MLRYYADLSEAEIAEALGARPGTVKSMLHCGIAELREVMTLYPHSVPRVVGNVWVRAKPTCRQQITKVN